MHILTNVGALHKKLRNNKMEKLIQTSMKIDSHFHPRKYNIGINNRLNKLEYIIMPRIKRCNPKLTIYIPLLHINALNSIFLHLCYSPSISIHIRHSFAEIPKIDKPVIYSGRYRVITSLM